MPSDRRRARLHEYIKRTMSEIIQEEITDPSLLISITEVSTSPDLQWADISVSVFPYDKHRHVMDILEKRAAFLQSLFNKQLNIRHTPKIRFKLDSRLEAGIYES